MVMPSDEVRICYRECPEHEDGICVEQHADPEKDVVVAGMFGKVWKGAHLCTAGQKVHPWWEKDYATFRRRLRPDRGRDALRNNAAALLIACLLMLPVGIVKRDTTLIGFGAGALLASLLLMHMYMERMKEALNAMRRV